MNNYKQSILLLVTALLFTACSTTKNSAQTNNTDSSSNDEITLKIEYTSNYCGGANPPDELIQKLKTPKKYSEMEIYLSRKDNLSGDLTKLKTDENGEVSTSLNTGTYYLFMPEKKNIELKEGGEAESCEKWKNTPNGEFTVKLDSNEVAISITKTCDTCGPKRL